MPANGAWSVCIALQNQLRPHGNPYSRRVFALDVDDLEGHSDGIC